MRKILNPGDVFSFSSAANIINLALVDGDIYYKIGSPILDYTDEEAYVLRMHIPTHSIYTGGVLGKTIYIQAGLNGAEFQYHEE